ncbi:hypothetical protein BDR26DRAFT_658031 [Obelidium mucronatum]|nr:hypothetical protein BDR26DRAFT_658031 [Obelidium mucronatum]
MGCVSSKEVKLEPQSTAEDKFLVDHHQQVVHTTGSNELRDFAVSHPPARETPIVDQGNEQPAVASNTLAAWVSEEKMQDLELISFELIQKLDVKQGGSITAETFHNLESSAFTEYQDKMTAFLDEAVKEYDGKLDDKSVKVVKETANGHDMLQVTAPVENCINDLITGIGLVADLHPLLKISWFIVSVGYRVNTAPRRKLSTAFDRRYLTDRQSGQ